MWIICWQLRPRTKRHASGAGFRLHSWQRNMRTATPSTTRIDDRARLLSSDVLLAFLVFSGGQGSKRRPVLVVHDFGDADLLVMPITSHPARLATDLILSDWRSAGLKLPSAIRAEKMATIEKTCVARKLGTLLPADLEKFKQILRTAWRGNQHFSRADAFTPSSSANSGACA